MIRRRRSIRRQLFLSRPIYAGKENRRCVTKTKFTHSYYGLGNIGGCRLALDVDEATSTAALRVQRAKALNNAIAVKGSVTRVCSI